MFSSNTFVSLLTLPVFSSHRIVSLLQEAVLGPLLWHLKLPFGRLKCGIYQYLSLYFLCSIFCLFSKCSFFIFTFFDVSCWTEVWYEIFLIVVMPDSFHYPTFCRHNNAETVVKKLFPEKNYLFFG